MGDATKEQRAADNALEEAITRVYRAYGGQHLPTHWVACLATVRQDAESGFSEVIPLVQPDLPWHSLLGILRAATIRAENETEAVDDD